MPVAVLEKKLRTIPQEYFEDISNYFDYIIFKANKSTQPIANTNDKKTAKLTAFEKLVGIIPDEINLNDAKTKRIMDL